MANRQLQRAIMHRDLILVQSIIIGEFDSDRFRDTPQARGTAAEAERELGRLGIKLFEPDDEETPFPCRDSWTRDAWTAAKVELGDNFSQEKLMLVADMLDYLRRQKPWTRQARSAASSEPAGQRHRKEAASSGSLTGGKKSPGGNPKKRTATHKGKPGLLGRLLGNSQRGSGRTRRSGP